MTRKGHVNGAQDQKADTRGRILGPKFGLPAFFGLLSVHFRPKADIRMISINPLSGSVI